MMTVLPVAVGCSGLHPQIESVEARIEGIDLKGIDLAFDVHVRNSLPMTLRPPNCHYGVDIADAEFVKGETEAGAELPARDVGTISFPARFEYLKLWRTYENIREAREVPYRLRGALVFTISDQNVDVPFSHEGKFPVLRPPSLSVRDVRTTDVSLRRAGVEVDAEIANPNVCDLNIDRLGYRLRLGEVNVGGITASTAGALAAGQSGRLTLTGEVTGLSALRELIAGGSLGKPALSATGIIQTPYGEVRLPD